MSARAALLLLAASMTVAASAQQAASPQAAAPPQSAASQQVASPQVTSPWPSFLSPEARAGLAANDARGPETPTLAGRRERATTIQQEIGLPRLTRYNVHMREDVIAGIPVYRFTPAGAADRRHILLNLHGGGFIVDGGSISENAAVAALTGYPVVAVRYRLAPEHAYPAALDDALAVYRALLNTHEPSQIGVYGTSAGAILSAQLVARLRAERLPQPAALGFFSGAADMGHQGDSISLFSDAAAVPALVAMYAGGHRLDDPVLSPQRGNLSGWPATLCLASGRDFLLSGTVDFCRALDGAGVSAKLIVYDGLPHAFWSYIDAPESDAAFAAIAAFFKERLGGAS